MCYRGSGRLAQALALLGNHMIRQLLATVSISFAFSTAFAGEPVPSTDALEKEILACLSTATPKSKCLETSASKHLRPGNEGTVPNFTELDNIFTDWLAKDSVYAIHPLRQQKGGDIYEHRLYVIEDNHGALMLFSFSTLKRLGKTYLFDVTVNSKREQIRSVIEGGSEG
jgi:hypothetical protein